MIVPTTWASCDGVSMYRNDASIPLSGFIPSSSLGNQQRFGGPDGETCSFGQPDGRRPAVQADVAPPLPDEVTVVPVGQIGEGQPGGRVRPRQLAPGTVVTEGAGAVAVAEAPPGPE